VRTSNQITKTKGEAGNVLHRLVQFIHYGSAILLAMVVISTSAMGQAFTALHHLNFDTEGSGPLGKVVISGGKIYGTAVAGGNNNKGTIFSLNTNGTGFSGKGTEQGQNKVFPTTERKGER
jgi:uncharacterized repeat protein (TIGR03803 family)